MIVRLQSFYKHHPQLITGFVILGLVLLAWFNRFTQDDAFISYRYAWNMAHGHGLVWNPGEQGVEGYTNFLWTIAMAGAIGLGIEPVDAATALGLACLAVTLLFAGKLAQIVFRSREISLLAIILMGTNYSFSIYATGGLETQLQAALFTTTIFLLLYSISVRGWNILRLIILSILSAAAILTRIDSVIVIFVIIVLATLHIWRTRHSTLGLVGRLLALSLPLVVIVGIWLVWKMQYYGSLLPNTFYAKVSSSISLNRGGAYIYMFLLSYLLIPFVILGALGLANLRRRPNWLIIALLIEVGLWLGYIATIGGDFMEFRFLVPIMPSIFILIVWILFSVVRQPEIRLALITLIVVGSFHHARTFGVFTETSGILTVEELESPFHDRSLQWDKIGQLLGKEFSAYPDVTIATTAAGVIPYYSHLRTIDMLGLNDAWTARNGIILGDLPGHQRIATAKYLTEQRVTLVLGHPQVERRDTTPQTPEYQLSELARFLLIVQNPADIPSDTSVIEIPLDDDYRLVAVYLVKNPWVDKVIQDNGWQNHPVLTQRSVNR